MKKRNLKKYFLPAMAFAISVTGTPLTEVSGSSDIEGTSTFIEDRHDVNTEFKAVYSNGLSPSSDDWFTITWQRELNADEDPDTVDRGHVEVNGTYGLKGYMEPGWYDVIGINYHGKTQAIQGAALATASLIRVYSDETVEFPVAVGDQAVKKLQKEKGETAVFVEEDGVSEYTAEMTSEGIELPGENPQSLFMDLSVFGTDQEVRQRYLDYLHEEGLVDENYQYTDKAKELMEEETRISEAYEPKEPEVISEDQDAEAGEDTGSQVSEFEGGEYDTVGESNVIEKRFDKETQKTENDKTNSSHAVLTVVIKYLPLAVAFLAIILALLWIKIH